MQLPPTQFSGISSNRPKPQQHQQPFATAPIRLPLNNQDVLALSGKKRSPLFAGEPPETAEPNVDNAETTAQELIASFQNTRVRRILEEDILNQNPVYGRDTRLLDQNQRVALKHLQKAVETPNMSAFKTEQVAKAIQKELHQIAERHINSQ